MNQGVDHQRFLENHTKKSTMMMIVDTGAEINVVSAKYCMVWGSNEKEMLGPNAGQTLNRIIRWTRTGLKYEPDQRHAEKIITELETCKSVSKPRVQESVSATRAMIVEGVEMDDKEARGFRALGARLNYLAGNRQIFSLRPNAFARIWHGPAVRTG